MSPPRSRWRRLQRPWISALLLALLLADAWWVLLAEFPAPQSRAAILLIDLQEALTGRPPRRSWKSRLAHVWSIPAHTPRFYLVRSDAPDEPPLRLLDQDRESWDELSQLTTSNPQQVAAIDANFRSARSGFWGITRELRIDTVTLKPWEPGTFDDVPSDAVRQLLNQSVPSWPGAPTGPADQTHTRILWWGYAHNAAALLALAAFILSLGWLPRLPAAYRARRGGRRLARGQCPRCRYPLAGLESSQCPECGEQWGTEEGSGAGANP